MNVTLRRAGDNQTIMSQKDLGPLHCLKPLLDIALLNCVGNSEHWRGVEDTNGYQPDEKPLLSLILPPFGWWLNQG